jgi:hypothetical protein
MTNAALECFCGREGSISFLKKRNKKLLPVASAQGIRPLLFFLSADRLRITKGFLAPF